MWWRNLIIFHEVYVWTIHREFISFKIRKYTFFIFLHEGKKFYGNKYMYIHIYIYWWLRKWCKTKIIQLKNNYAKYMNAYGSNIYDPKFNTGTISRRNWRTYKGIKCKATWCFIFKVHHIFMQKDHCRWDNTYIIILIMMHQ